MLKRPAEQSVIDLTLNQNVNMRSLLREKGTCIFMKTLRQAKIGDKVRVVKLHGEGAVKRRIMDMGITKSVEITVRKVAPLGDPIEISIRGYELSIRKADAEMIEIE